MTPVLLVAVLSAAPQTAGGQEEEIKKALAVCAALGIETARLDCFEQLARAVAQIPFRLPGPRVSKFKGSAEPGKWKVDVGTSPIDGTRVVALSQVDETDSIQLVLRCRQGKPEVSVVTAKDLGGDSTVVTTRVGDAKAETRRWPLSSDHRAAQYPGDAGALIFRLLLVQRFVVHVSPPDDSPITAVFKLDGLPSVATPLKQACRMP
jgi:hypothetical protein